MNHRPELLQNEEFYFQCGERITNNIVEVQRQIYSLRKYLGDRKKEIIKKIRNKSRLNVNNNEGNTLNTTREFYEYALKELMKIEQVYEEYLFRMKTDLLTAVKDRLQPPSYVSLAEVQNAYKAHTCSDTSIEPEETEALCGCNWKNIEKLSLEETRNILVKPRATIPTEFDESDLKFKEEITALRTKMFSLPKRPIESYNDKDLTTVFADENHQPEATSAAKKDFIEITRRTEKLRPLPKEELLKINNLKFTEGKFTKSDIWSRILDAYGHCFGSIWHLALRPQIEKITMKRHIPVLYLNPRTTFDFLSTIQKNGIYYVLTITDLIHLLRNTTDVSWLTSRTLQFQTINGKDIAATLIQSRWRGYWLRKRIWESERRYIAASEIWFAWISLKKKREMHERYLTKMLKSLHVTRELSLKLSNEFDQIIDEPHVIVHLPSLGYPLEIRRTLAPKLFAIHQNTSSLRLSLVRNPKTEVIYVLPVKPTQDLLMMYSDIIESVSPDENLAKRITFIALSQTETFRRRSLNVSRILHCSEESLQEIRKKIAGKSAYFLPWIIDECDMRLAGNLNVPLLSPDMELQRKYLNMSRITKMIDGLGLMQPVHRRDIKDYDILCNDLAELIVMNTEVCSWLIKLNFGTRTKHYGVFLINHMSIPFMPILRNEREKYGDEWTSNPSLRERYLKSLMEQLPKVVSMVTRLSSTYKSWKDFYTHIQRFGCLLQATPSQKNASVVSVALFVPGKATGEKPKWIGTADRIYLESMFSTFMYMIPQSSLDTAKLEPVVNKFAEAVQNDGYFGYLAVDCYCYPHKHEDKLVVLLLNINPYYSHLHGYIDWMKFAIAGWYSLGTNTLTADVSVFPQMRRRKSSYLLPQKTLKWDQTSERYGIVVAELYHSRMCAYRWPKLKALFEECGITYNSKKKEGSNIILHDGEMGNTGMMVAISPSMPTTLTMIENNLKKIYQALMVKFKPETNFLVVADFISKLSLDYQNLAADPCVRI